MGIIRSILVFAVFLFSLNLCAQDAYVRHTVQAGETVYSIAQCYKINPGDIAKYNPDVSVGLREGTILIIPQSSKSENAQALGTHEVQPKETLYGLSKQYNCMVEELIALNPELKDGLKIGATIRVPIKNQQKEPVAKPTKTSDEYTYYTVSPKETVYSICKAAGISEAEFLALNPEVKENGLQKGQTVKLPKSGITKPSEEIATDVTDKKPYDLYSVQPEDDLNSIAKRYSCNVEALIDLNPELKDGLVAGRYIVVPVDKVPAKSSGIRIAQQNELFWHLPSQFEHPSVHMALLAPFYLGEADTTNTTTNSKQDRNKAAIQFMAGFKVALDTLAALGYNIELDVFDTKNEVGGIDQVVKNIRPKADLIIGPFYAKSAEQLAAKMPSEAIYSPLSKAVNNKGKANLIDGVNYLDGELRQIAHWINGRTTSQRFVFVNTDTTEVRRNVNTVKMHLGAFDSAAVQFVWTDKNLKGVGELIKYKKGNEKTTFVVVDQDPAFITNIMRRLYRLKDTNMVLLTTSKIFDITAIEPRQLNQVNIVATQTEFVDYNDTTTQQFIWQYRQATGTEPSKYAYIGYDTGLYFAQLIAAYGRVPAVEQWPVVRGVYKGFDFVETPGKGPVNTFAVPVSVRDYKIILRGQ